MLRPKAFLVLLSQTIPRRRQRLPYPPPLVGGRKGVKALRSDADCSVSNPHANNAAQRAGPFGPIEDFADAFSFRRRKVDQTSWIRRRQPQTVPPWIGFVPLPTAGKFIPRVWAIWDDLDGLPKGDGTDEDQSGKAWRRIWGLGHASRPGGVRGRRDRVKGHRTPVAFHRLG